MRKLSLVVFAVLAICFSLAARSAETTAYQAITDDFQSGLISAEDYIINLINSVKSPESLDPAYRDLTTGRSGTIPLVEAYNYIESLPEADRARLRPAMARPTGLPEQHVTTHFRFHYTTSGSHATSSTFVTQMATAFENSWEHLATTRGYDTPPSDGSAGGCHRYDVYIRNLSSGILGYCEPEANVPSTPHNDATSFIVMRNSYAGYSSSPIQMMQQTAVHELFHGFQMGYDVSERPWWMELSSTWIMNDMYPTYHHEFAYLPTFFSSPHTTIQTYNGSYEYSTWLFGTYLARRFGINTMRDIWEQCKWVNVLSAMQGILSGRGSSRNEAFSEFFTWNLFTGSRHIPALYPDGAAFPEVRIERTVYTSDYPVIGGSSSNWPDNLASNYFRLTVPPGASGPFSISFDGATGGIWSAQLVMQEAPAYTSINIPLDGSGYGYYVLPEAVYSEYSDIYLIVGMLSTSGSAWNFNYSAAFDTITAALNPPTNLRATSGLSGRVPLAWDAPEGAGGLTEISYDDGVGVGYFPSSAFGGATNIIEYVRFTSTSPCTLQTVKFMAYNPDGTYSNVGIRIWGDSGGDAPGVEVGTARSYLPSGSGWEEYDISGEGIAFPAGDFFLGIHRSPDGATGLFLADSTGARRSFAIVDDSLLYGVPYNFLLRAVVRTAGSYRELTAVGADGRPLSFDWRTPNYREVSAELELAEQSAPIFADSHRARPEEPVDYYNIYRSTTPGGPWTFPIATSPTEAYEDIAVINDVTYYYVVSARYASGESRTSNQVSATPGAASGDTLGDEILINADLYDTLSALSFWPLRPGTKFGERLELDRPAKIKSLWYYALNIGTGRFVPGIHHWTGERITGDLIPPITQTAVGTTLVVVDVEPYNIYVNSDFVVSFGIYDSTSFILSQRVPSDDRDWMNLGWGWFIPDSARFIIGAEVEFIDPSERYSLEGYVNLSGGTGGSPDPEGLDGSIVRIEGLGIAETTDVDGYYEFDDLEPGTYIVSANRVWYEPQSDLVSINGPQSKDFNLIPYNLPVNPPRLLTAESFNDGAVPLRWWPPIGSPGTSEWHTYWEYPESLFYYRPGLAPGSVECTRFDLWAPCTLTMARLCFYDSAGVYDNIEFHVWGDDGAGFPDFRNELIDPIIISPTPYSPTAGLQWTYVNFESLGVPVVLLPGDQVHIGVKHITSRPSLVMDDTTPLESPTRSKIFDAGASNWDADLSDFLLEVHAKYFDIGSRPAPPRPKGEPGEIAAVSKKLSPLPAGTAFPEADSPRERPMAGISVEFYDIYRTTDLDDTTTFELIASVPGDSTNWVDESATNNIWNAYYIKTNQSHGMSGRSNYAIAYPKAHEDSAIVLLVDDDGSSWGGGVNESWAYIDALDSLGIPFNGMDLSSPWMEGPTPAQMFRYDAVIWFTGMLYSDSTTLMASDEANIQTYLTAGGNFALFSQDYLWDRYEDGVAPLSWPALTFGLDSVEQDVAAIPSDAFGLLMGTSTGPFADMTLGITSPFGNTDLAPDGLFGPNQLMNLSHTDFAGPVMVGKRTGTSRTFFSTVPLSAIYDTTSPNNKYDFMFRLLDEWFEVFGPENVEATFNVSPGWNLLSIPVELDDYSPSSAFPGHSSDIYYYDPATSGYAVADSIVPGLGYWVLFTSTMEFSHIGAPISSWTRSLARGWNLVGSVMSDDEVPLANAQFVPEAFMSGNFYGFDGSAYTEASGFTAGEGYWILVSADCEMTLDAHARRRSEPQTAELHSIFAHGVELKLAIGAEAIGYMPPPAPFDRHPSAHLVHNSEKCQKIVAENGEFTLKMAEAGVIRSVGDLTLAIEGDKFSGIIESGGELFLPQGTFKLVASFVPSSFALHQAVPNPFNATTKIAFDIPSDSHVELEIFDIQGRLVRRLVSGDTPAGFHSVIWDGRTDAGSSAPSGVYLYRIRTDGAAQTKRMMLIE
ncbi:MAG TPA: T9SS type A sorting domain-containing protein [candidate division Zixibacteria bacterium]|nr:T9SS type A sorting domain-containing protein [candidate division Zixibacteria bacterium]